MVARAGWQLIQPAARPHCSFRAPLEYMVGRELHCRVSTEPPNGFGGEHPRGELSYPKHIPFAETRNKQDNENRGVIKPQTKETPLAHSETSGERILTHLPIYIRSLTPAYSNAASEGQIGFLWFFLFPKRKNTFSCCDYSTAASGSERLFFAAFFSRKESAFPSYVYKISSY